jgi:hypothetical protein
VGSSYPSAPGTAGLEASNPEAALPPDPAPAFPVGYPADDCVVPKRALERKPLDEILVVR